MEPPDDTEVKPEEACSTPSGMSSTPQDTTKALRVRSDPTVSGIPDLCGLAFRQLLQQVMARDVVMRKTEISWLKNDLEHSTEGETRDQSQELKRRITELEA